MLASKRREFTMNCNVGNVDRIIRAVLGVILLAGWIFGWFAGALAIVLGIVGIILLATAAIKFCPLYRIIGASTCQPSKA